MPKKVICQHWEQGTVIASTPHPNGKKKVGERLSSISMFLGIVVRIRIYPIGLFECLVSIKGLGGCDPVGVGVALLKEVYVVRHRL